MKSPLSLKLSVAVAFLFLGIVIVLAYSAISRHFFILGMDNIVSANMEHAAKSYVESTSPEYRNNNHVFDGYEITHHWSEQPEMIQQLFKLPLSKNRLYKHVDAPFFSRPDVIHFLIQIDINNEHFYISRRATIANASKLIGENIHQSKRLIWTISSGVILALILIIWLMLRRVSQPISQLVEWTHSLTPKTLNAPPPNFSYSELNEMAELIRTTLSASQRSIEREERFLGFASHELRTPISIIRNNIELLAKLKQSEQNINSAKFDHVVERIDRASLTMKHLSETLLWLSRDNNENLPQQTFRLDKQIEQLISEMKYLLNNKPVNITVNLNPYEIHISQVATQIVIGNLIRNAFQHTWQGEVIIKQQDNHITIANHCQLFTADKADSADQGFGLGLELTKQLCQKLHWHYQNLVQTDGHLVALSLQDERTSE